ncbi:hypothetical protein WJX73_004047 [Symbiochloris irregularis]|uniref:Uncharacterized protein n=1 Tax=Symbiochloris irregularis TaxID=706552 RepID=A0AAW1P4U1_9CHLO
MAANIPETPYRALGAEILDFGKPYTGPYPHNFDSKGSCLFSLRYTVGFRSRTRFKVNGALQEAESCVELSPCGHRPRFKVTLCNAEEVFRGKAPREQDSPSAAWGECCKWRNNQTGKSTSASGPLNFGFSDLDVVNTLRRMYGLRDLDPSEANKASRKRPRSADTQPAQCASASQATVARNSTQAAHRKSFSTSGSRSLAKRHAGNRSLPPLGDPRASNASEHGCSQVGKHAQPVIVKAEVHLPGHMTVTTAPGASQDWAMHDDLLMLESIDQLYKWDDQLAAHTKKLLQHPEEDLDAEQIKERQLMLVELKLRREQIERVVRSMS